MRARYFISPRSSIEQAYRDVALVCYLEAAIVTKIRINALEVDAFLEGFYPAEIYTDGSCFRWTGPSRVSQIRVTAERSKILLGALTLLGAVSKINLQAI